MIKDDEELHIEISMLKVNIDRMCISDKIMEIREASNVAMNRIDAIYDYNYKRACNKQ